MTMAWDIFKQITPGSSTLVSFKADVVAMPFSLFWGQNASGPTERIAVSGTLQFVLENREILEGVYSIWGDAAPRRVFKYSPDYTGVDRLYIGSPIWLRFSRDGGSSYIAKKYYVADIKPEPGEWSERTCTITCNDYIGRFGDQKADALTVLSNKRVDEALTSLIALFATAPENTKYSTGLETLAYIFHDISGRASLMNAAQRLLQSDLGYLFAEADGTDGETLTYQNRNDRQANDLYAIFDNSMQELDYQYSNRNIFNRISCKSHPVNIGISTEVLFTLQTEQQLSAGQALTLKCLYRDPGGAGQSVRLAPGTEVTPVHDTDYDMHTAANGGGSDIGADLGVAVTWYADNASVTLTNNNAGTGYVNLLQLRGKIIRLYDAVEMIASAPDATLEAYGEFDLSFDMPYQDNPYLASGFSNYLLTQYGIPGSLVRSIGFEASTQLAFLEDETGEPIQAETGEPIQAETSLEGVLFDARLGYPVQIRETVTGVIATYWISGIEITINPGSHYYGRFYLEPAIGGVYWSLGEVDACELGLNTILDF